MSLEFANRICPNCNNPNYMVYLGKFLSAYKYKCMNCNRYFNDSDFGEPLKPVWKRECMNTKVDMVEVVRCKDCKQSGIDSTSYPQYWCSAHTEYHDGDWFCADGERKN